MKIFIGMETSGQMRRRLQAMGHDVISCDMAHRRWRKRRSAGRA